MGISWLQTKKKICWIIAANDNYFLERLNFSKKAWVLIKGQTKTDLKCVDFLFSQLNPTSFNKILTYRIVLFSTVNAWFFISDYYVI